LRDCRRPKLTETFMTLEHWIHMQPSVWKSWILIVHL